MAAPTLETLEERMSALEAEVQQLKQRQEQDKTSEEPRGWQKLVGAFEDMPGFEEGVLAGRKWREAQRPPDYEDAC